VGFFRVLVHGAFTAHVRLNPEVQARGFYTTRWVFARDEAAAAEKAFNSARSELKKWSDVRDGLVSVAMDAEDVQATGPWHIVFRGGGRGFAFYGEE